MLDRIGEQYNGFTVQRIRQASEWPGRLVELIFEKTKTPLCWMDNGEDNRLFSIFFSTLPEDDTGVFHILEHSLLSGSEKYPVKEPFVELLKSSMNTFLNAITFPDMTMFPVSSRNDRDFLNLVDVYLDGIFHPLVIKDTRIFHQEGWHLEEDEDGWKFNGVVFNEMKGSMSSVQRQLQEQLSKQLYPNHPYGYNSGGMPEAIVDLTDEQLVETYHRFYHPSNARVFLDGNIPIEKTLDLLGSVLEQYDYCDNFPVLEAPTAVISYDEIEYSLPEGEQEEGKTIWLMAKRFSDWQHRTQTMAGNVLAAYLSSGNESPLSRAMLSEGLCEEFSISVDDDVAYPFMVVQAKNVPKERVEDIPVFLREQVRRVLEEGLDKEKLLSHIRRMEFSYLETDEPQGLDRCLSASSSWLYGGDPMEYLCYEAAFEELRSMVEAGTFEQLLKDWFFDGDGAVTLIAKPSTKLEGKKEQLEQQEVQRRVAAMDDQERAQVREQALALEKWHDTPDSPEALASLPTLPLSEVQPDPAWVESRLLPMEDTHCYVQSVDTRGIVYYSLYFRLTDYSVEELGLLGRMARLLGQLPTAHHDVPELQKKIQGTVGRLDFTVEILSNRKNKEVCTPVLVVRCAALQEQFEASRELIEEILFTSILEKEKIREIVHQINERLKRALPQVANGAGAALVLSKTKAANGVADYTSGYHQMQMVHLLDDEFDERFSEMEGLIERLRTQTLCRSRFFCEQTCTSYLPMDAFASMLPEGTPAPETMTYTSTLPGKGFFEIPARVGAAFMGGSLDEQYGFSKGSARVAANILELEYLWQTIRVAGGAYGASFAVARDGDVLASSYRDPSPGNSLQVMRQMGEALRQFLEQTDSLDSFILSTIAADEPLRTPWEKGMLAARWAMTGWTKEDMIQERKEVLATSKEELLHFCEYLDHFVQDAAICVASMDTELAQREGLEILQL